MQPRNSKTSLAYVKKPSQARLTKQRNDQEQNETLNKNQTGALSIYKAIIGQMKPDHHNYIKELMKGKEHQHQRAHSNIIPLEDFNNPHEFTRPSSQPHKDAPSSHNVQPNKKEEFRSHKPNSPYCTPKATQLFQTPLLEEVSKFSTRNERSTHKRPFAEEFRDEQREILTSQGSALKKQSINRRSVQKTVLSSMASGDQFLDSIEGYIDQLNTGRNRTETETSDSNMPFFENQVIEQQRHKIEQLQMINEQLRLKQRKQAKLEVFLSDKIKEMYKQLCQFSEELKIEKKKRKALSQAFQELRDERIKLRRSPSNQKPPTVADFHLTAYYSHINSSGQESEPMEPSTGWTQMVGQPRHSRKTNNPRNHRYQSHLASDTD